MRTATTYSAFLTITVLLIAAALQIPSVYDMAARLLRQGHKVRRLLPQNYMSEQVPAFLAFTSATLKPTPTPIQQRQLRITAPDMAAESLNKASESTGFMHAVQSRRNYNLSILPHIALNTLL